jgi:hypothetical protein
MIQVLSTRSGFRICTPSEALESLAASGSGEADRTRAVLLTLNGWTSARIAESAPALVRGR